MAGRRGRVVEVVAAAGVDGILVTLPANVRYLTGFTGSNGWLLLADAGAFFLTDPRYAEQAAAEVADAVIETSSIGLPTSLGEVAASKVLRRLAFEPAHVTVALKEKLDAAVEVEWMALEDVVETQRAQKDSGEIEAVRAALALTEAALEEVAATIEPGQTETEVAAELERACRRRGAESMAFETIVASGPRSALPHGVASTRVIEAGEPVMIDMGCRLGGYCSDITRMVWVGASPQPRWRKIHDIVDRARAAGLSALRAGVPAEEVDAAARQVVAAAGYGDAFSHGTGHGVGLEIHEAPTLSGRSNESLKSGMVVTIEPAVYLEGELGIRIEDLVYVTDTGCECLTTLSTDPILRRIS
jgi:Xaa-Pro aminopeptidase